LVGEGFGILHDLVKFVIGNLVDGLGELVHLFFAFGAEFAAETASEELKFLFAGIADEPGDFDGVSSFYGNHCDSGGIDVSFGVGGEVSGVDIDGHFDGGASDVGDDAIEFDEFADFDWGVKVDSFEGGGDADSAGVSATDGAGGEVDEGED
jgi:hypothetical protein